MPRSCSGQALRVAEGVGEGSVGSSAEGARIDRWTAGGRGRQGLQLWSPELCQRLLPSLERKDSEQKGQPQLQPQHPAPWSGLPWDPHKESHLSKDLSSADRRLSLKMPMASLPPLGDLLPENEADTEESRDKTRKIPVDIV